jgi:hypothetical protein
MSHGAGKAHSLDLIKMRLNKQESILQERRIIVKSIKEEVTRSY